MSIFYAHPHRIKLQPPGGCLDYIHVEPTDICIIKYLHGVLSTINPNYNGTLEDFVKCRKSIYIANKMDYSDEMVYGMIGVRKTTMEELGIDHLDYYCMPNHELYSIDFLYSNLNGEKFTILGEYIDENKMLVRLINEALSDKNDGFAALKMYAPTGKTPDIHDSLIEAGFKINSYNPDTETYIYTRSPRTY